MDSGMTVYEFNKQLYSQMNVLPEDKLKAEISNMAVWMNVWSDRRYFMLNNYELKWFTIFAIDKDIRDTKSAYDDLLEVVNNIGQVVSVEYEHDMKYYEIWIRARQDGEIHMFVLFNCTDLVVEVE